MAPALLFVGSILLSHFFFLCDWSSLFSLLTGILVFALFRSCMFESKQIAVNVLNN